MSSTPVYLSEKHSAPVKVAVLYDTSSPIEDRIGKFEAQTKRERAGSRISVKGDHPEADLDSPDHSKGRSTTGLASPSITPPSAYNKLRHLRNTTSPVSNLQDDARYQREAYSAPETLGAAPASPESIASFNAASTVDYLLQSAASPRSPSASPDSTTRVFPTLTLAQFEASLSDLALDNREEDAITGLFCLRTDNGTHVDPRPSPPVQHYNNAAANNALSSLPLEHKDKLSCAFALMALLNQCQREEELRYRKLLLAKNLTGDENLYSDADTIVDDGKYEDLASVPVPKTVKVVDWTIPEEVSAKIHDGASTRRAKRTDNALQTPTSMPSRLANGNTATSRTKDNAINHNPTQLQTPTSMPPPPRRPAQQQSPVRNSTRQPTPSRKQLEAALDAKPSRSSPTANKAISKSPTQLEAALDANPSKSNPTANKAVSKPPTKAKGKAKSKARGKGKKTATASRVRKVQQDRERSVSPSVARVARAKVQLKMQALGYRRERARKRAGTAGRVDVGVDVEMRDVEAC